MSLKKIFKKSFIIASSMALVLGLIAVVNTSVNLAKANADEEQPILSERVDYPVGDYPWSIDFSPNGQLLVSSNYTDNSISLFKVNSDGSLIKLNNYSTDSHSYSASFSPNGNILALIIK